MAALAKIVGFRSDSDTKMPVLFVGHGSPMNIVQDNSFTKNFSSLGSSLPKPSAILAISAHWETRGTQVLAVEKPRQIYDFGGFPEELYRVKYEPLGAVGLATQVSQLRSDIKEDSDWGLDHGTWAVLHHMYPKADIPTLQLSLNTHLKPLEHLEVARSLRPLRNQGVLLLSSGNIVHNLRRIEWDPNSQPLDWAIGFEKLVLDTLQDQSLSGEAKIDKIFAAPDLRLAHPSLEHLIPLIYTIGLSDGEKLEISSKGIQNASISMACVRIG